MPSLTNTAYADGNSTLYWIDRGTEFVYTTNGEAPGSGALDNRAAASVTTYGVAGTPGTFAHALAQAQLGPYNASKPYVILIGDNFTLPAVQTITGSNITLRKVEDFM